MWWSFEFSELGIIRNPFMKCPPHWEQEPVSTSSNRAQVEDSVHRTNVVAAGRIFSLCASPSTAPRRRSYTTAAAEGKSSNEDYFDLGAATDEDYCEKFTTELDFLEEKVAKNPEFQLEGWSTDSLRSKFYPMPRLNFSVAFWDLGDGLYT